MTVKTDIQQLAADATLFHAVVHGDANTTVAIGANNVKSLAKAVADAAYPYASATASATAAAASATAAQNSANAAASVAFGASIENKPIGLSSQVTIGTSTAEAAAKVTIRSAGAQNLAMHIGEGGTGAGLEFWTRLTSFPTGTKAFIAWGDSAFYGAGALVLGSRPDVASAVLLAPAGAIKVCVESAGISPYVDNAYLLGLASKRWSTIYAGTGTINTSDAREKTAVAPLTADELECSKALAKEIGTYRFLGAVAEKGAAARLHIGMTVQRAIEIFEAHGLDPMRYGCICYDQWSDEFADIPEERDDAGNLISEASRKQTQTAGDRYSFRPDELLLFIARGFDARLSALEAAA